jgi:hypothetical protein
MTLTAAIRSLCSESRSFATDFETGECTDATACCKNVAPKGEACVFKPAGQFSERVELRGSWLQAEKSLHFKSSTARSKED